MTAVYGVLKVVHVLSVVAWIGGATALGAVTAMLIRARDRAALSALLPRAQRYGQTVGGPSSILVLLTGGAMVGVARIPFTTLWVLWGLTGIVLHFVIAIGVLRKRGMRFARAMATPGDDAELAEAGRALRSTNVLYLLIMASVIVVMVLKPTL